MSKRSAVCAGIMLLSEELQETMRGIPKGDHIAVLTFPLKKGVLEETVTRLLPAMP